MYVKIWWSKTKANHDFAGNLCANCMEDCEDKGYSIQVVGQDKPHKDGNCYCCECGCVIQQDRPKTMQQMVQEFHQAFNHPIRNTPTAMRQEQRLFRSGLMVEEVEEFINAVTVADQADALVDLLYFAFGTAVEMGVDLAPVFRLVHKANMAKLGAIGKPVYRADGKVLKPEGWQHPDIEGEIKRQEEQG